MLTTTSLASFVFKKIQSGALLRTSVNENKCEHLLKDIRFYLKMEQCERGGKIVPFLGVKTDLNENGFV